MVGKNGSNRLITPNQTNKVLYMDGNLPELTLHTFTFGPFAEGF